jgi:hypothetical protein
MPSRTPSVIAIPASALQTTMRRSHWRRNEPHRIECSRINLDGRAARRGLNMQAGAENGASATPRNISVRGEVAAKVLPRRYDHQNQGARDEKQSVGRGDSLGPWLGRQRPDSSSCHETASHHDHRNSENDNGGAHPGGASSPGRRGPGLGEHRQPRLPLPRHAILRKYQERSVHDRGGREGRREPCRSWESMHRVAVLASHSVHGSRYGPRCYAVLHALCNARDLREL